MDIEKLNKFNSLKKIKEITDNLLSKKGENFKVDKKENKLNMFDKRIFLNQFKISYLMVFFYYIFMISSSFSKIANIKIFQLHSSYIILKIRGIGKKTIAYYRFYNEVFINGKKQNIVATQYCLNDTDNEISHQLAVCCFTDRFPESGDLLDQFKI